MFFLNYVYFFSLLDILEPDFWVDGMPYRSVTRSFQVVPLIPGFLALQVGPLIPRVCGWSWAPGMVICRGLSFDQRIWCLEANITIRLIKWETWNSLWINLELWAMVFHFESSFDGRHLEGSMSLFLWSRYARLAGRKSLEFMGRKSWSSSFFREVTQLKG